MVDLKNSLDKLKKKFGEKKVDEAIEVAKKLFDEGKDPDEIAPLVPSELGTDPTVLGGGTVTCIVVGSLQGQIK